MNEHIKNKQPVSPFWTIWFPLIVVLTLVVVLVVFLIIGTAKDVQVSALWSQISTIFLIIPAIFLGVIIFLVLVLSVRGMNNLILKTPPFLQKANNISIKVNQYSKTFSKVVVAPVVWIERGYSFIKNVINRFKPFFTSMIRSRGIRK